MKRSFIIVCLCFTFFRVHAQEDDLRQVIRATFYHPEVLVKVFFEYKGTSTTFLQGYKKEMKGAFVLPDTTLQSKIPNLLELVGTAHARENYFMTITLISNPEGNVYISSNILDPAILLFVDFDKILIANKKASLEFHTTALHEKDSLKDKYVSVVCELRKRRKRWRVANIKIEPISCCSSLW
jgi:hypothetical protein